MCGPGYCAVVRGLSACRVAVDKAAQFALRNPQHDKENQSRSHSSISNTGAALGAVLSPRLDQTKSPTRLNQVPRVCAQAILDPRPVSHTYTCGRHRWSTSARRTWSCRCQPYSLLMLLCLESRVCWVCYVILIPFLSFSLDFSPARLSWGIPAYVPPPAVI